MLSRIRPIGVIGIPANQLLGASMTNLHELRDLEARISSGDPDALYLSGMMYWTGRWIEGVVIPQDKRKALDMIQRAADFGHGEAAVFIAQHCEIPNVDVEHLDKDETPDAESTSDFSAARVQPTQSGEMSSRAGDPVNVKYVSQTEESWLFETVISLNGNSVSRLRSGLFYWSALGSFILGIFLIKQEMPVGGFLILTLAPFLLLYPPIRFLFGGKDSVAGIVTTFVIEEIIKHQIFRTLDDRSHRRRK
jgi:hypothetical protein